MFGKVKKIFFTGVFGALYISFIAQFIYVLALMTVDGFGLYCDYLAALSLEWLILIAARYLSKKSSGGAHFHGYNNNRRR